MLTDREDTVRLVVGLGVAILLVVVVLCAARWGDPGMPTCPHNRPRPTTVECAP